MSVRVRFIMKMMEGDLGEVRKRRSHMDKPFPTKLMPVMNIYKIEIEMAAPEFCRKFIVALSSLLEFTFMFESERSLVTCVQGFRKAL